MKMKTGLLLATIGMLAFVISPSYAAAPRGPIVVSPPVKGPVVNPPIYGGPIVVSPPVTPWN